MIGMKEHLMAWNRCYGCMSFEIHIAPGETIKEKKEYYESIGYYCWVWNDAELKTYYTTFE